MSSLLAPRFTSLRRPAYAAAAVLLAAAGVAVWLSEGAGGWLLLGFAVAPDLALLAGGGRGLEPGQLHPRAVPLYNALHRLWGPAILAAVALAGVLAAPWLAGALAWGAHIALDRAVGYGLRTRDGRQRG